MAATPQRGVHWNIKDLSPSLLDSPLVEGSTESYIPTSSLEYVNAQLVAHGYIPSPGLSLEGLSNIDSDKVIKCLLGMLGQRIEDMSRAEQLSTKLRTLTYDHERLLTMHRTANEKSSNAEREMNVHKARLTAAMRTLQTTEAAHKHTTAELQRVRSSLQSIRATYQSELKKKEKDIERMTEKWNKMSEAQIKLMTVPAGLRCANLSIVDGSQITGRNQTYMEMALDDAEKARAQLMDETLRLRRLVLKIVNQTQALLHQARCFISEKDEEPSPFVLDTLFPMQPPTFAHDTLTTILNSLRDCLAALPQHIASTPAPSAKPPEPGHDEIARLQDIVSQLRKEVERSQKQSIAQAAETQAIFDQFIADQQKTSENITEMSMELMTAPMMDKERERFDGIKRELDEEREQFTQAAIKLGKERASLEAERLKFLDEKRSWQVQMLLADLPPTPNPPSPHKSPRKSPKKSPKKTSRRLSSMASPGRKTTRVSRRPSITPAEIIPAYETEVLPPLPAPSFPVLKPATSILPSFVLPPPSPHTSLPSKPILPASMESNLDPTTHPETMTSSPIESATANPNLDPNLTTPIRRPFPMAKPLVQRMIHAYSPAKPSPLSRILLLAKSPSTPEGELDDLAGLSPGLEAVREEDEIDPQDGHPLFTIPAQSPDSASEIPNSQISLAAELGVEASEAPLQEKRAETHMNGRKKTGKPVTKEGGGVVKKYAVKPSSKGGELRKNTDAFGRTSVEGEKENGLVRKVNSRGSSAIGSNLVAARKETAEAATTTKSSVGKASTRNKVPVKPASSSAGIGPRRVPIDSKEAPAIARRGS